MTNVERKVEAIRVKNAGLSFVTDVETILKKEYGDIWNKDLSSDLVVEMVQELLNKDESEIFLYFNSNNELRQLRNFWDIRNGYSDHIYGDESEIKQLRFRINFNYDKSVFLNEIYKVTDIDGYIDYMLEQRNKSADKQIEDYKRKIQKVEKEKEETAAYAADAKRFNESEDLARILTINSTWEIAQLRKAEKVQKGELTLAELAGLTTKSQIDAIDDDVVGSFIMD